MRVRRLTHGAAVIAVCLAGGLAACSSSSHPPAPPRDAGILVVHAEQRRGPCCSNHNAIGVVIVVRDRRGHTASASTIRGDAHFVLAPGHYQVDFTSKFKNSHCTAGTEATRAVVMPHRTAHITLFCDYA